MAQVWVTHEELADLCGCSAALGRAYVRRWRWAERMSSEGVAHVQLPADLAFDFMSRSTLHRLTDQVADRNMAILSTVASKSLSSRAA